MTSVFKKRPLIAKLGRYIKRMFCLKVSIEDEDYLCYRSKLTTSQPTNTKNDTSTLKVPKSSTNYPKSSSKRNAGQNKSTTEDNIYTKRSVLSKRDTISHVYEVEANALRTPAKPIIKPKPTKKKQLKPVNKMQSLVKKLVSKRPGKSSRKQKKR